MFILLLSFRVATRFVLLATLFILLLPFGVATLVVLLPARFLLLLPLARAFDTPLITTGTILGLDDADCGNKAETEADHKCL